MSRPLLPATPCLPRGPSLPPAPTPPQGIYDPSKLEQADFLQVTSLSTLPQCNILLIPTHLLGTFNKFHLNTLGLAYPKARQ